MTTDLTKHETAILPRSGDDLEEMKLLADEAPLKLVAQTIHSMGGRAKVSDIKKRLEPCLRPDFTWSRWWERVLPEVQQPSSRYFRYQRSQPISLTARVDSIPKVPWQSLPSPSKSVKGKSASVADWRKWFKAPGHEVPPGRFPTKSAVNALGKFGAKDIEAALERTLWGAENFLTSDGPTPHAAAGWSEALSRGFTRYRELTVPQLVNSLAKRTGTQLAGLFNVAADADAGVSDAMMRLAGSVRSAWDFPGTPLPWRGEFAAGMWRGWHNTKYARTFFEASCSDTQVVPQERTALAVEITASGLSEPWEARRFSEFDRILDNLPSTDRPRLFFELMVGAEAGRTPKDGVLDYIGASRHAAGSASSPRRLELTVIASLLLAGGEHPVTRLASQDLEHTLAGSASDGNDPTRDGLLAHMREYVANLDRQHRDELKVYERKYDELLEEMRKREDVLNAQVERLGRQLEANREEARMDILQDPVTVITETMQDLRQWDDSPGEAVRHMQARLMLALRVAGAEEFGAVGETVPYDPVRHRSEVDFPVGSLVRISAPGVVMPGKAAVDRILVKASVEKP